MVFGRVGYQNGCRPEFVVGSAAGYGGSPHWPDVGRGKERPVVTTKPPNSPICPGSGTFPDIVNNLVLEELTYVCAICRASVPNFELVSIHRHALHRAAVLTVRVDLQLSDSRQLNGRTMRDREVISSAMGDVCPRCGSLEVRLSIGTEGATDSTWSATCSQCWHKWLPIR